MKNIDLKDFTFLIPLRIDSINRLENTLVTVEYLMDNYDTQIDVLEASSRNTNLLRRLLPKDVNYVFIEDLDDVFHRTKYINQLVKSSKSQYIVVWDTDIIVPVEQLNKAVELLRNNEADFVTPFKNKFLDTSEILRDLYLQNRELEVLKLHQNKMKSLYLPNPVGGAFFANRKTYIDAGMENEKFYGWGREDGDRVNRWKILGYRHQHIDGLLFHLTHERGRNSTFHSPNQDQIKMAEVYKSLSKSKQELQNEINKW
ncbi:hypothetical protein JYB64_20580 [Algoriphagus aestuarii]|nr:hypothetical protein [Algoriphagus aestuarii]